MIYADWFSMKTGKETTTVHGEGTETPWHVTVTTRSRPLLYTTSTGSLTFLCAIVFTLVVSALCGPEAVLPEALSEAVGLQPVRTSDADNDQDEGQAAAHKRHDLVTHRAVTLSRVMCPPHHLRFPSHI